MSDLKTHIQGQVHFLYYRDGDLWYETDSKLQFPVPVQDTGTAMFKRDDKAILFMRYIRKWMKVLESL